MSCVQSAAARFSNRCNVSPSGRCFETTSPAWCWPDRRRFRAIQPSRSNEKLPPLLARRPTYRVGWPVLRFAISSNERKAQMTGAWYFSQNGEQLGPVPIETLRKLAVAGQLTRTDFVWTEGMSDWVPAERVASLLWSRPVATAPSRLDLLHNDVFNMDEAAQPLDLGVRGILEQFRSLDYGFLLPLRMVVSPSLLRRKAVRWVIGFSLFPLTLAIAKQQLEWSFEISLFALGAYFCFFWSTYFHGLLGPSADAWRRGLKFGLFTIVVGLPLLLIAQSGPVMSHFYRAVHSESLFARCVGFVLGVGIAEETCKALPLLLFVTGKRERLPLRDGLFLGMMSGFGFALAEVFGYSIMYWWRGAAASLQVLGGQHAAAATMLPRIKELFGTIFLVQMVRFMTLPLLHAAWSGTVGWFIAIASTQADKARATIVVGIGLTAVLHGLYDVFSDGVLGLFFAAVSLCLFMAYLVHGPNEREASA
jgi:RsiW-degrading membrane proteinase PrsW (M82 family)